MSNKPDGVKINPEAVREAIASKAPLPLPTRPETLSADDMAYHAKMVADMNAYQLMWNHWVAHLTEKYKLAQGDGIQPDGLIVRKPPEEETGFAKKVEGSENAV